MEPPTLSFHVDGHRLTYDIRGSGDRTVVLVPGLLMPRRMHTRLANLLADSGFRVACLEPLGFGESDRPPGHWHYSMRKYARQVVRLLDELGVEHTVLFGTSAGANITLATAVYAPERLCGVVAESPVLERGVPACVAVGAPAMTLGRFGAPGVRLLGRVAARIPRSRGGALDLGLSWFAQDSRRSVDAVEDIVRGGIFPPRAVRSTIRTKTLVIGHGFDPIHPLADDLALAWELPDARFVRARSILELRRDPSRLAAPITEFISECWDAAIPLDESCPPL